MKHPDLIARLSLEEKASFVAGKGYWHTMPLPVLDLPAVEMTDGPHGLRKMADATRNGDFMGLVETTAYPTASLSACSFDPSLLGDMGTMLADECLEHGVALILGPGVNLKRSPLCGRNFEYFSEDPLLSSSLAAAMIRAIESRGVGTSLKHFAANNQETRRMTVDAAVDPRALRELYLASFEGAVRRGGPSTVMCAYNRLNGPLCSENRFLLTEVLRDEWGWDGVVVTDWGASHDRIEGLRAGVDLEMPSSGRDNERRIVRAVRDGSLDEGILDAAVDRLLDFALRALGTAGPARGPAFASIKTPDQPARPRFDAEAAHELSRRVARESAVLLKNDGGLLPLDPGRRVTVIGELARSPRFQGAGSSYIKPTRLVSFLDALRAMGVPHDFAAGYPAGSDEPDPRLADEAVALARAAAARGDAVICYAGLTDSYESEGFDREHMRLPANQAELIPALAAACPDLAVVFVGGSPVETPWLGHARALLAGYLGGQASGQAQADLVFGAANPAGKLAETWPLALEDNPSHGNFPGTGRRVLYKEGIFVGYRWYASAGKAVRFPFGHGLSYTRFAYERLELLPGDGPAGIPTARVTLRNVGGRTGAEVAQVYAGFEESRIERPALALAGFAKLSLEPGQAASVDIPLDPLAFRHWDQAAGAFDFEDATVTLRVGPSSAELPLSARFSLEGRPVPEALASAPRRDLSRHPAELGDEAFEAILGAPLAPEAPTRPHTLDSLLQDLARDSRAAALVRAAIARQMTRLGGAAAGSANQRMLVRMADEMPLSKLIAMSGGALGRNLGEALVALANKRPLSALARLLGLGRPSA